MSKLSLEEIEHIAKLSKLDLTKEEKERYSEQLSNVLEYVGQLSEIDTDNVEATSNITGLSNITREDKVEESGVGYHDIKINAPKFEDGNFIVPGVFE